MMLFAFTRMFLVPNVLEMIGALFGIAIVVPAFLCARVRSDAVFHGTRDGHFRLSTRFARLGGKILFRQRAFRTAEHGGDDRLAAFDRHHHLHQSRLDLARAALGNAQEFVEGFFRRGRRGRTRTFHLGRILLLALETTAHRRDPRRGCGFGRRAIGRDHADFRRLALALHRRRSRPHADRSDGCDCGRLFGMPLVSGREPLGKTPASQTNHSAGENHRRADCPHRETCSIPPCPCSPGAAASPAKRLGVDLVQHGLGRVSGD